MWVDLFHPIYYIVVGSQAQINIPIPSFKKTCVVEFVLVGSGFSEIESHH